MESAFSFALLRPADFVNFVGWGWTGQASLVIQGVFFHWYPPLKVLSTKKLI